MTYNMIMKKVIATKTLGPMSAVLLEKLHQQGKVIFTLDDAMEIYDRGRQETTHFLRDLVNRGILARIKSGVFLILQMGQETAQLSNWPLIAKALMGENDYTISHYSAMRLHGMTTHPLVDVFITMPKRFVSKKILHVFYRVIYSKSEHLWGVMDFWVTKQDKIRVTDLERTILDGLERPDLCGGLIEVVRGIWSKQKEINWEKMVVYSKKFHTKAAIKRLGYILELLNVGEAGCISSLEKIISSKKDYVFLDPNGEKEGVYLSRWRLRININDKELKASVWA